MMADIPSACSNKGCGKQYSESSNSNTACEYHFGEPVFHEGLKGWSCCSKRTPDFEEFLKIPGCVTGKHSSTAKAPAPKSAPAKTEPTTKKGGVEVYGSNPVDKPTDTAAAATVVKPVIKESELFDPKDTVVKIGTKCQRPGCTHVYDGTSTKECVFHEGTPVFHEGSKSWSCCPRKVLEFEEFLKITGCSKSVHRYTIQDDTKTVQKNVIPRHDWYQTQTNVNLSVFAKGVDKVKSSVVFEESNVKIDIVYTNGQTTTFQTELCQPIDPTNSSFKMLTTKIELLLAKANGISWPSLEPCENVTSWTTFGTVGQVGTVGGKEAVVAGDSPIALMKK